MIQNGYRTGLRCVLAAGLAACGLAVAPQAMAQGGNPVFQDLLQRGVPFGANNRQLRTPTLADGLKAAGQQQAINAVLAAKPGMKINFAAFTDRNLSAPFVLLLDDPAFGGQNKPGHSIDLWFVVWGNLPKIVNPAFLKQQFQPDPKDHIDVIPAANLPKGIQPQQIPGGGEYFVHAQFMIFSNDQRLQLSATGRATQTTNQESSTLATIIDQRFNQDPNYPNEWRPVLRGAGGKILLDAKGNPQLGAPTLYVSAGGYVKITTLAKPNGALLVEYHLVYYEPQGWFNGQNLLRTKLNIKTEDDVRQFRRQVIKAAKEEKPATSSSAP